MLMTPESPSAALYSTKGEEIGNTISYDKQTPPIAGGALDPVSFCSFS